MAGNRAGTDEGNEIEPSTERRGPHGVTLVAHAQIAALIAEGDRSSAAILDAHELSEAQWIEATIFWMTQLGDDVRDHGQGAQLPHAYSAAFSSAQDAMRPLPATDAASYAKLVVDIQVAGGPAQPLAVRGLSTADYLRLSRHWAGVLSSDPTQSRLFFETYQALQPIEPGAGEAASGGT